MDGYDSIWIHVMTLLLLLLTLFRKFEAWFLDFTGQMYYLLLMFQSHTGQFSQMRGHRSRIKPKTQTNVLPNTSKSNTHEEQKHNQINQSIKWQFVRCSVVALNNLPHQPSLCPPAPAPATQLCLVKKLFGNLSYWSFAIICTEFLCFKHKFSTLSLYIHFYYS